MFKIKSLSRKIEPKIFPGNQPLKHFIKNYFKGPISDLDLYKPYGYKNHIHLSNFLIMHIKDTNEAFGY